MESGAERADEQLPPRRGAISHARRGLRMDEQSARAKAAKPLALFRCLIPGGLVYL